MSKEHKAAISKALMGNTWSNGKNLGNKNSFGKLSGKNNGNWKGGKSNRILYREIKAKRPRGNRCEICYEDSLNDFDHDHKTGIFRGWICRRCNLVLGMVKDNPILLKNLALYLEVNSGIHHNKSILKTLLIRNYALSADNSTKETPKD